MTTTITPPRAVEALLSALGAEDQFRDALLGDMAEEFNTRAERDGVTGARRWYVVEALRSSPHLLRNWASRAGRRDASRIAKAVITSVVGLYIAAIVLSGVGFAILHIFGVSGPYRLSPLTPLVVVIGLSLGAAGTLLGGVFAASMDNETPMLSALAFAVLWAAIDLIVFVFAPQRAAWQAFVPLIPLVGVTLGGALRTAARRSSAVSPI